MNIEIIRGDTKSFKFQRRTINNEVITEKPDKMFFTVKTGYYSKDCLFQKRLDTDITYKEEDSYYYFTINPSNTDKLDYDDYVFDIEIIKNDIKKTIAKGTFKVESEVTFAENEV